MNVAENLFYTKEHEWVKIDGSSATVGITDHAQTLLGDITFIELPKVGDKVQKSKPLATVESVKAASDVYAPISGTVAKVNNSLLDNPAVVNQSPYGNGWFLVIDIENEKEKESLLSASDYKTYLEGLS